MNVMSPLQSKTETGGAAAAQPRDITMPFITMDRLRMETDGDGVTTLVASKGCPLSCRYCINKNILCDDVPCRQITPRELYEKVRIDDLYFRATKGGVVFGGGESLLHARFIRAFAEIVPKSWQILAETSLNVPTELLRIAMPAVTAWIVDIKDMNPDIYRAYTGMDNALVKENLRVLAEAGRCGDVTVRVPLIPGYNTEEDCRRSIEELRAIGSWKRCDPFPYVVRE
ncbi:MAG: radical SAM protein [Lachnospiraceae bacterium]|nr:radical SAM protein [Lachnospiraceae bacterium]